MTLQEAKNLKHGTIVYHKVKRNADKSPMRAKVTSVKTWKRFPERVEIGLKHGLYDYAKFNQNELDVLTTDENEAKQGI